MCRIYFDLVRRVSETWQILSFLPFLIAAAAAKVVAGKKTKPASKQASE